MCSLFKKAVIYYDHHERQRAGDHMKRFNRPVEMVSVFHEDCSYPKPVKFKHRLDDGKVITINVDRIISERKRKWGEIITVEYDCESTVMGKYRRFLLEFTGNRLEWKLVKISRRLKMKFEIKGYDVTYNKDNLDAVVYKDGHEVLMVGFHKDASI